MIRKISGVPGGVDWLVPTPLDTVQDGEVIGVQASPGASPVKAPTPRPAFVPGKPGKPASAAKKSAQSKPKPALMAEPPLPMPVPVPVPVPVPFRSQAQAPVASPSAKAAMPLQPPLVPNLAQPVAQATRQWEVRLNDKTFSQVLARWSRQAGWQMIWEAERDFPIDANVTLLGSFEEALAQAMGVLAQTDYPLQVVMNDTTQVMRVLRHMQSSPM